MSLPSPENFTWQGQDTRRGKLRALPFYILFVVLVVAGGGTGLAIMQDREPEKPVVASVDPPPQLQAHTSASAMPPIRILNQEIGDHASSNMPARVKEHPSTAAAPRARGASARNYFSLRAEMLNLR